MANYNTFIVVDCRSRQLLLVTSSVRKALGYLKTGIRIEVWNSNCRVEVLHESTRNRKKAVISHYVELEREHVRARQAKAEERNKRKRQKIGARHDESNV